MSFQQYPAPDTGGVSNFAVNNTALTTVTNLTEDYPAGGYTITCTDSAFDIYLFNSDGSSAGYTNIKSITATKSFNKIVIIGGSTEIIQFEFKASYDSSSEDNEVTAGPFITSASTTSLFTTASTAAIVGGNFASDATGTFTSATTATVYTATITRNSATSITLGRPSTFPAAYTPYTLTLSNPGITNPTGSNLNKLSGFSAGTIPVITSPSTISYTTGAATSITLTATDSDGATSGRTWAVSSGTLPTGLSLDASTGVLSGTPTTSQVTVSFTVTDAGNNTSAPASILFNGNPVWVTAAGALPNGGIGAAYSTTLSATDDTAGVTYSLTSGTLPTGLSLNASTGVISGTPSSGNGNTSFTVTATDTNGGSTARSFSIGILISTYYTASTTWTAPAGITTAYFDLIAGGGSGGSFGSSNVGCSGAGAGGKLTGSVTVVPGTGYSLVIGGGGAGVGGNTQGNNGTNTTFASTQVAFGGGGGGANGSSGNGGGCGGGGSRNSGGAGSQGFNGGSSSEQWTGSGGGGLGAVGQSVGFDAGNGGAGITLNGYTFGGGGGGAASQGSGARLAGSGGTGGGGAGATGTGGAGSGSGNTGGGGGGSCSATSGAGGSGLAFIGYLG